MGNWLMYPCQYGDERVFRKDYRLEFLDSVKGILIDNQEIPLADSEKYINIQSFEEELEKNTGLWITQSKENIDFIKNIFPKVQYAVKKGKQIFCTRKLSYEEEALLEKTVPKNLWITSTFSEKWSYVKI